MTEKAKMELEVLQIIKKYGLLKREQVLGFFPGREKAANRALISLENRRRIFLDEIVASMAGYEGFDHGLIAAVWVMLDFGRHKEIEMHFCHDGSEYPIRLYFTAEGIEYDVIYLDDHDIMIGKKALKRSKSECSHIIVVPDYQTIEKMQMDEVLDHVVCYCTVDESGEVTYYRR